MTYFSGIVMFGGTRQQYQGRRPPAAAPPFNSGKTHTVKQGWVLSCKLTD